MIRLYSVILGLFFVGVYSLSAQTKENHLLLMNGKTIEGDYVKTNGEFITYAFSKKAKKFEKDIDILRVYSYLVKGKESIMYRQDTAFGNVLTVPEMRMFVYGEQDAVKNLQAWPYFVGGFATGLGLSIADTYGYKDDADTPNVDEKGFFKNDPSFLHFATPFVFTIIAGTIKPKIKMKHVTEPTFLANEQYVMGFQKASRSKRLMKGLIGSLAGSITGIVIQSIAKSK